MIDEKVGEIMAALETNGYLENAVVIFTSDHGDCLTDHGHSQKWTMYDQITHIPLVVSSPGRFQSGLAVDQLCQQMDLGPTILELAGIPVPGTFEAETMLPALSGESWAGRDHVFAEQARDAILTGCDFMTMVRNKEYKLVHFLDQSYGQLFDLVNDPAEVNDRWSDPELETVKQDLLSTLREWRIRSGLKSADWCADFR
jgi:arylsulfatase A-like enzyme